MTEEPTQDPAAAFRAEMARRGMISTPETRERARKALADTRTPRAAARREAARDRGRRGVAEMFGRQPSDTPAT